MSALILRQLKLFCYEILMRKWCSYFIILIFNALTHSSDVRSSEFLCCEPSSWKLFLKREKERERETFACHKFIRSTFSLETFFPFSQLRHIRMNNFPYFFSFWWWWCEKFIWQSTRIFCEFYQKLFLLSSQEFFEGIFVHFCFSYWKFPCSWKFYLMILK